MCCSAERRNLEQVFASGVPTGCAIFDDMGVCSDEMLAIHSDWSFSDTVFMSDFRLAPINLYTSFMLHI